LAKKERVATTEFMAPEPVSALRIVESSASSYRSSGSSADRLGQPAGRGLLVDHDDLARASHASILRSAGWLVVEKRDSKQAASPDQEASRDRLSDRGR
jgi:hypothetical protein